MASVSFPGSTPIPRGQPMPQMQTQQSVYSDVGQGLRQTGQDLDVFEGEIDEERDRQSKLEDMVNRRTLALRVQRAKEEFNQKNIELKEAEAEENARKFDEMEKRRVGQEARLKEDAARKASIEKDINTRRANLNSELERRESELAKVGKVLSRDAARVIVQRHGFGENWEKYAKDRPYQPRGGSGSKENKDSARREIAFREDELQGLLNSLNRLAGTQFDATKIVKDAIGIDFVIQKLPRESEKRRALERYQERVHKKIKEINDAKIDAGLSFEQKSSAVDQSQEIKRLQQSIAEKEAKLKALNQ